MDKVLMLIGLANQLFTVVNQITAEEAARRGKSRQELLAEADAHYKANADKIADLAALGHEGK